MQEGAGIAVPASVRCGWTVHSWVNKSWNASLVEGIFLLFSLRDQRLSALLPHTWTHPTPGPHSFRSIVLWRWADVSPASSHIWWSSQPMGFVLEGVPLLDHKKHKERTRSKGLDPDGNTNCCSQGIVFLITLRTRQTKLPASVFLIYATVGRSKVHFHYTFDVI